MLRIAAHALIVGLLTLLTQLGGLAWLIALASRRRLPAFLGAYVALGLAASVIAPHFGRVALSCWRDGPLQVQSWFYCAANRTYMKPELAAVLDDAAAEMAQSFPGTETLLLDAGFPFFDGFPLPPHLSHDDGEKADLAFYYQDAEGYAPGRTRSPIGYFAFEKGPTACKEIWPTMRWNLRALQPLWSRETVEPRRLKRLLEIFAADHRVGKIFLEPHLQARLGVASPKIRFQGCRAARHDDHIHIQL